ncbi:hypothetical protein E2A64_16065 [Pseudohoeflea suaedae]|uniref:PIG-L family deacetylase n=1 Tax=Pseudohoeflea suaedae TaxID=877384 RepID=A0A4R5PH22_9HYPH|nr:PIG-L family deacetylase [Pseudohoeflea suaedae]TDH34196.1 hypothetical protein E2A64_16065 [Pseudohoeflea suaedae]
MTARPEFLNNSLIIGAHPDDELLWFNAILHLVDEVAIVYRSFWAQPDLAEKRAKAIAAFPRDGVFCLDIEESGAYGCANWASPEENDVGLAFTLEWRKREVKRAAKRALGSVGLPNLLVARRSVLDAYRENFELIRTRLRPRLRADMNVFTHNPWGEYGHEEHVQVFRALQSLQREIGFKLWMSNYCSERTLPLAMRYFQTSPGGYIRLPTNKQFAEQVAQVYKDHQCWTWSDDWAWFDEECYILAPDQGKEPEPQQHLLPLNMFTIAP